MKKLFYTLLFTTFVTSNVYAGCMKTEIKQLDAKLNDANISSEIKEEVSKLRDIVAKNEHSNSELAFQSYEKALKILGEI